MLDAIPLGATHGGPRLRSFARRAWRAVGHALARLNGTAVDGALYASDMAQLRGSMHG